MASSTVASSAVVLDLLNMDNYEHWSLRVKTYLLAEGLWKVVEANGDPPKLEDNAWSRKNAKALHVIHISCGSGIFPLISNTTSARVAWDRLARRFQLNYCYHSTDERSDFPTPLDGGKNVHYENMEEEEEAIDDERSNFPTPLDGGKNVHDENMEEEEEAIDDERFEFPTPIDGGRSVHEVGVSFLDERSYFPTPIDGGRNVRDENMKEEEATDGHDNNVPNVALQEEDYFDFFNNIGCQDDAIDWDKVTEFLKEHPETLRLKDSKTGQTDLHMAVRKRNAKMVEKMVQFMEKKDLEIEDFDGRTAFYYAVGISSANIEIVKCLVRRNNGLVSTCIPCRGRNLIPVVVAAMGNNWEVADYLYHLTPKEDLNGPSGADIVTTYLLRKKCDIPRELIQRYPNLAITQDLTNNCPLNLLAGLRPAFFSGTPLTFWQRWIYECIRIEDDFTSFDVRIDVQTPKINEGNQMDQIESATGESHVKFPFWQHIRTYCNAVRRFFHELFMALLKLFGIFDGIHKIKLFHVQVLLLLECMSQVTKNNEHLADSVVQRAIFLAIQRGHVEFVKVLVIQNQYADAVGIIDRRGRNLFKFAIECRQEKVYNLMYEQMDDSYMDRIGDSVDFFENSMLHLAGGLSPSLQFDHIRDAALQMQRELQWFKEVESFVSTAIREHLNFADNMTARELFTKNHKQLVKEGEKSMKETATSCTVVGALIVTIMFAAAFTVAGGNNQNTGLPVFLDDKLFIVFIVSDAFSLFASTTSVMIFLGILTSRYAEDDFLTSLPSKMMVGLLTLFFSIATMMVAFSTTLIIMLHDKYSWVVFPIISLACIPITAFVWMQFPLLKEICVSTYGPGIFGKRRSRSWRYRLKSFYTRMKGKVVRAFSLTPKSKV